MNAIHRLIGMGGDQAPHTPTSEGATPVRATRAPCTCDRCKRKRRSNYFHVEQLVSQTQECCVINCDFIKRTRAVSVA